MPWSEARSRARIEGHLATVPEFDQNLTLAKQSRMLVEAQAKGVMDQATPRKAFVVEAAHLYGQLLDFDSIVADRNSQETEASHREALRFLNMHYGIWDSIVENDDAERVDYHGVRMHAIVPSPEGDARRQLQNAIALATKLGAATKRVAEVYGFRARIRFGIDQGKCVAMTTGRSHDRDTLFLGAPANHAAKLAAAADEEGIFLTPSAQAILGSTALRRTGSGRIELNEGFLNESLRLNPYDRIDRAADRLIAERRSDPQFVFRRETPPLAGVKFVDLVPSNSVRMGMSSIFADIDGFTAFVDGAIRSGGSAMKQAAIAIHVIREELNDVLKLDFGGKRIRFIGDCIHGVLAETPQRDDGTATVRSSVLCASGMKSSFDLCKSMVGGIDTLDLAIGIEYGIVPITRIGKRGKESVRCAGGRAVVVAERVQQSIPGGGIDLGPTARSLAEPAIRRYFVGNRLPTYGAATDLLSDPQSPAIQTVRDNREARGHASSG